MQNLFGEEVEFSEEILRIDHSPYKLKKQVMNYRQSFNKNKECRNCVNYIVINHHDKRHKKCEIIGISKSSATDILAKNTCNRWKDTV